MQRVGRWDDKDPNEVAPFQNDWSDLLNEDTISSSTFSVVSGSVTIVTQDNTDTLARCALSGGTLDETCEILNHIVTEAGYEWDQTTVLRIRKR